MGCLRMTVGWLRWPAALGSESQCPGAKTVGALALPPRSLPVLLILLIILVVFHRRNPSLTVSFFFSGFFNAWGLDLAPVFFGMGCPTALRATGAARSHTPAPAAKLPDRCARHGQTSVLSRKGLDHGGAVPLITRRSAPADNRSSKRARSKTRRIAVPTRPV